MYSDVRFNAVYELQSAESCALIACPSTFLLGYALLSSSLACRYVLYRCSRLSKTLSLSALHAGPVQEVEALSLTQLADGSRNRSSKLMKNFYEFVLPSLTCSTFALLGKMKCFCVYSTRPKLKVILAHAEKYN